MKKVRELFYNDIVPTLDAYHYYSESEVAENCELLVSAIKNKDEEYVAQVISLFDVEIEEKKEIVDTITRYMSGIYEKALNDYNELCRLATEMSFEALCKKVNGYNLQEEDLFDCNFKSIRTTVWNRPQGNYVKPHIDIWNDKATEMAECGIDITSFTED